MDKKGTMKNHFQFQALEHFVALARAKNFTRAGRELNLSQSALSRSIQKLEDQLGQPLFERKPREVILTDLGTLLLERAKALLQLAEDTFAEVSEAGGLRRVRLGAIPTIAPYFLPRLLGEFAENHADIAVVVQEDTTDRLIANCCHGDIDLAIVALPLAAKDLQSEPLFTEEMMLVLPLGHPLAAQETVKIEAVNHYPFVMLSEAHCLADNIVSFCRRQSVQPVTVERTSQLATVQELVALDHGISMVPNMARQIDVSERRIYRSFSGEKPTRTVAMMWNPYRHQSEAVHSLMQHLRSSAPR